MVAAPRKVLRVLWSAISSSHELRVHREGADRFRPEQRFARLEIADVAGGISATRHRERPRCSALMLRYNVALLHALMDARAIYLLGRWFLTLCKNHIGVVTRATALVPDYASDWAIAALRPT